MFNPLPWKGKVLYYPPPLRGRGGWGLNVKLIFKLIGSILPPFQPSPLQGEGDFLFPSPTTEEEIYRTSLLPSHGLADQQQAHHALAGKLQMQS